MFNFQKLILSYQYQKEEIYNRATIDSSDEDIVIIYDRGLLDNKAYITDLEFTRILEDLSMIVGRNLNEIDLLSRYDMVIHLVTSAGNKGYSLENNKARYESEEEAILLDRRTMNSWIMHDNFHVVSSTENFEDKINSVRILVYSCLDEKKDVNKKRRLCS